MCCLYFTGTLFYAKKVFNIGAGWHAEGATASHKSPTNSVQLHNQSNLGVDVFLDMPIKKSKGTAISVYSVFTSNYGPKVISEPGYLEPHAGAQTTTANAETSWAIGRNLQPTIGTGSIWYTQVGYLLPKLKNGTAFMPYATFTYKKFDRIGKASGQYDLGLNYLINNHNAKITLQYSSRPVYKTVNNDPVRNGSKGEFILQNTDLLIKLLTHLKEIL